MLIAELWSLSPIYPHEQVYVLTRIGIGLVTPQLEHVLVEGNHLSILISCLPCSFSLYFKKETNIPQPLSKTLFQNLSACDIPFISKSSTITAS